MNLALTLHGTLRQLPLVLCGPILRRATPDSVTVWVALHSACSVKLIILDAAGSIFESGYTDTLKIGLNLHIACITAQPNVSTGKLVWNKLYYYDLKFSIGGVSSSLEDPQICRDNLQSFKDDFCYGNEYPGFVMPPDSPNLNSLRIAHGSCRKPHGAGLDALGCIDILIKNNYQNPVTRPQLLCLTGDQIYADEVDDNLIKIIDEVAKKIFGYPLGTVHEDRQNIIKNINFTSTEAKNHLLSFVEFAAMYLLVWSEELWPLDISDASDDLNGFKSSLKAVRRALANIPTYMVFDDHEITDDWNRQKSWREKTYCIDFKSGSNTPLDSYNSYTWAAHSVIADGLLAYALFQGWGNLGTQADTMSPYKDIVSLCPKNDPSSTKTPSEDSATLFYLQQLMLPSTATNGRWTYLQYNAGAMPWSFRVDYPGLQIIGLDSRNLRGYKSGNDAPAIIYPGNIIPQLGNNYAKPLTIVLCGAPIFGVDAIEMAQGYTDMVGADDSLDKEAWCFDIDAFHKIQIELAKFKKVVVLSGDVHYGFSTQVQFWDDSDPNSHQSAIIAQCCSSSQKNKNSRGKSAALKAARALSVPKEKVWLKTPISGEPWLLEAVNAILLPLTKYQQLRLKLLYDYKLFSGLANMPSILVPFDVSITMTIKMQEFLNSGLISDSNIGILHFSGTNLLHELITPMPDDPKNLTQTVATHIIDFQLPLLTDKPLPS